MSSAKKKWDFANTLHDRENTNRFVQKNYIIVWKRLSTMPWHLHAVPIKSGVSDNALARLRRCHKSSGKNPPRPE
jgi:hypothetical protein